MHKTKLSLGMILVALFSACSHSAPKAEDAAPTKAVPANNDDALSMPTCGPNGCASSSNDYLNSVALPEILNAKIVHECFISNPRASAKELKSGFLSFRFEIRLAPEGDHVVVDKMYLSSFQNVPEWTKPCLNAGYKKLKFPPFPDKDKKFTNVFGTVNITWTPKKH